MRASGRERSEEHTSELQSPISTLFPYTTLFRSGGGAGVREFRKARWPSKGRGQRRGRSRRRCGLRGGRDRKSTRLNSSHRYLLSFPTRRSSDLVAAREYESFERPGGPVRDEGNEEVVLDDDAGFGAG